MSSTIITQQLKAPRDVVYRVLLDPQAIEKWKVPTTMTCHVHEFDAREGGVFRVSLTYNSADGVGKTSARTDTYHGRFVKLIPNEKIVELVEFETMDPAMRGEMTITTSLTDMSGGTELHAVHENLPPGVSPEDNELGWTQALAKLAEFVESAYSS